MNSIKAFLKAKGLYLVCLALVFAATITGIAAIRSVVRGVEDLTRIQKQALEEGTDVWDSPDAAVNQPAQDVPVATAQPSPAPSAAGSASSSLQQGAGQSGSASGGTGSSAASSAQQGTLPHAGWNGKVSQAFSGNTLVYNPTLGDWRTHNGTDYTAEQVTAVAAGTVTAIADDALWGRVVEVTDAQDRVWRYCGLEEVAVTQREKVTAGTRLGTTGNVPAEAQQGSHLHLECRKAGACLDPEKNKHRQCRCTVDGAAALLCHEFGQALKKYPACQQIPLTNARNMCILMIEISYNVLFYKFSYNSFHTERSPP